MDVLEKVGREVKEVIWKTCSAPDRSNCRVPLGCERVGVWDGVERSGIFESRDFAESCQNQSDSDLTL